MSGKGTFGSSVSMNNEFNFKGKRTEIKSKGKACTPVKMGDLAAPVVTAPFVPLVLGAIPVCSGMRELTPLERSVMGAISAAGSIQITQDPETAKYMFNYILSLLKVVNGAAGKTGRLSGEELKKLLMSLMGKWLEEAGPGFVSYKEVLMDLMEHGTLQDFMKGMQDAVCAIIGDPVNANTGNFIYEKEDLAVNGRTPLSFKRFYNSTDKRTGVMGAGWRHNYEIQLLLEKDRYIILWGDGREEVYLRSGENVPEALFGLPCRLRQEDGHYLYETQEKVVYTFDSKGKLITQKDSNGQGLQLSYDKNGRLGSVQSSSGTSLHYEYDSFCGLLCRVTDHTERSVSITYELERLKEVKNPGGQSYIYTYGPDKRISRIRNPRGVYVLENIYDEKGRATEQKFADGGRIRYDYQEDLSRTLVTEQNGNKVAYVHDERFRNVKTVYVDGEESFAYNDRNQLVCKTDKNGNRTKFSYDDRGNTTQIIYADGEKHNMTYDSGNHLAALSVNGVKKMKNTYNTKGNLIKMSDALGRCREAEYDDKGNILTVKQPDGSKLLMGYDKHGNIREITDGLGNVTAYTYDGANRVVQTMDGNGNKTRFQYDACNRIISVTNAAGKCRSYEYTKNGKLSKTVDYNGAVTIQKYNQMNHVASISFPDGGEMQMEYDLSQNVTKRIYPNGSEASYQYDPLSRLEQMTLPNGGTIQYEYDLNGNCTAAIDSFGQRTSLKYDERSRITAVTDPCGARTGYEYDMEGNLISITNAMGKSCSFAYDEAGQKISETDFLGNKTQFEYSEMGNISCLIDPRKHKTIYEYYPGGRLKRTVYADGETESYSYDQNGNVIRRENNKGDFLTFEYDCLDQMIKVKSSFGQEKSYTYDEVGNITSIKDVLGHVTKYEYSLGGKLIAVTDAAGNKAEYAYDVMGNLITVCHHEGSMSLLGGDGIREYEKAQVIQYERNLMGKLVAATDAVGETEHYIYNEIGQMVTKRDKEGYETMYRYTPVGDIEQVTYADGRSVFLSYNPLRQLMKVQDWLGTTTFQLDEAGRPEKIADHEGRTVEFEWDTWGNKSAVTYPDDQKVCYEYDDFSRLICLTGKTGRIEYQYNDDGSLREKTYPNGLKSRYRYTSGGLLRNLRHEADGTLLDEYKYEYDLAGNKKKITKVRNFPSSPDTRQEPWIGALKDSGLYEYSYDSMNHLAEISKDHEVVRRYQYDAFGNRTRKQENQVKTDYIYNEANQLQEVIGSEHRVYSYDKRGNVIHIIQNGSDWNTYRYNEMNQLAEAGQMDKGAQYIYNGLGRRVRKLVKGSGGEVRQTDYILDLTKSYHNLLQKEEEGQCQTFIWDENVVSMTERQAEIFYLHDEMGSPIRLLNPENKSLDVFGYDEFGVPQYGGNEVGQPFTYTGFQRDEISRTDFAQAREYAPELGRFLGTDLYKGRTDQPMLLNYYSYCVGNPLTYIDPEGLYSLKEGFFAHTEMEMMFLAMYGDGSSLVPYIRIPIQGAFSTKEVYGHTNVGIPHSSKWGNTGYADMILNNNGTVEVYEIKPDTYHDKNNPKLMERGKAQLDRYVKALKDQNLQARPGPSSPISALLDKTLPYIGKVIEPMNKQTITYHMYDDAPGMIYYTINKGEKAELNWEAALKNSEVVGAIGAALIALKEFLETLGSDLEELLPELAPFLMASNDNECEESA